MIRRAIPVMIGLIVGNFFVQAFTEQNWRLAVERSFFQVFAIAILLWFFKGKFVEVVKK
jgi:hypothetical protein